MKFDVASDDQNVMLFAAPTEEMVKWLEENRSEDPRTIFIGETGDIVSESQYLDLAT